MLTAPYALDQSGLLWRIVPLLDLWRFTTARRFRAAAAGGTTPSSRRIPRAQASILLRCLDLRDEGGGRFVRMQRVGFVG